MSKLEKIIVICGQTAVGKTSLSLQLAKGFAGEIISADSRQIYRNLNIGTDKVSKSLRKRIPHHLIDIKNPDEKYTAGDFVRDADKIIEEIIDRGKMPFVVGGTGFYIKALLEGLCDIPPSDPQIRKLIENEIATRGSIAIYEELEKVDPVAAKRVHPNNERRIVHYLEVFRATGKPISEFWQAQKKKKRYDYFVIYLTLDRDKLYRRINDRVDEMITTGLISEVQHLLDMGFTKDLPGMNTLGYVEILDYINGETDREEAVKLIKQHMRNYAKRQYTWFSKINSDLTIYTDNLNLSIIKNQIETFIGD